MKYRKAQSLVQNKVVWAIILLLFAGVIFFAFFAPKGLLTKIVDQASSTILKSQPEKKQEGLAGSVSVGVPSDTKNIFDSLAEAFKKAQKSQSKGICYVEYKHIPADFEYKIELFREDGLHLRIITPEGRSTQTEYIPDLEPCIIGGKQATEKGERDAAQNFYSKFIDAKEKMTGDGQVYNTYQKLSIIEASGATKAAVILPMGYRLDDEGLKNPSTKEEINLLFKADNNHVCFFVTKDGDAFGGCDASDGLLDDDCIPDIYNRKDVAVGIPMCA